MSADVGRYGENVAVEYLISKGYIILQRNYRQRIGEIDIICKQSSSSEDVIFVEVKARILDGKGKPYEAVSERKVRTLQRVAEIYVSDSGLGDIPLSLHVISIEFDTNLKLVELIHFRDVWYNM